MTFDTQGSTVIDCKTKFGKICEWFNVIGLE